MLRLTHADFFRGAKHPAGKYKKVEFPNGADVDGFCVTTTQGFVHITLNPDDSITFSSDLKPTVRYESATVPVVYFGDESATVLTVATRTVKDAYVAIPEGEFLSWLYLVNADGKSYDLYVGKNGIKVRPEFGTRPPTLKDFQPWGLTIGF